jgi:hypothetical protein
MDNPGGPQLPYDLGQRTASVKFMSGDRAGQFISSFDAMFTAEGKLPGSGDSRSPLMAGTSSAPDHCHEKVADHHDPVMTNNLPGGKPESAAKTRAARLRRST